MGSIRKEQCVTQPGMRKWRAFVWPALASGLPLSMRAGQAQGDKP
jgi:hypothetical protein